MKNEYVEQIQPRNVKVIGEVADSQQYIVGMEIPAHDYIVLTYVPSGNGTGEIETVTYKTGGASGTTVGILTLAYDANNKLSTVTKS
jgi:hypothetical protein